MQDSVRAQEIALTQWVTVKNWSAFRNERENGQKELLITCEIVNPTSLPMTIERTEFGCRGFILTSSQGISVPPNEPFRLVVPVDLEDAEYAREKISASLRITVWFKAASGKPGRQTFSGILLQFKTSENTRFALQADMVRAYEQQCGPDQRI
jgi:hypothetical protein